MSFDFHQVKDSGERENFFTGARRDTQKGKGRYDLLPFVALHRLAKHFENGAIKYDDNNWKKGIPTKRYMDSALRHLGYYASGMRDEDHLAAAAWNVMCMMETQMMIAEGKLPKELDDYEKYNDSNSNGT